MNKIFQNRIFIFLLGMIISGTTVYAISISADQIEYSTGITVKDKIDDLYTKVKPTYSGSTNITPTTSSQILNTNNKILNSNITINAIPSQYKNISDTTITSTSDILSGMIAYSADGTKLTGTRNECVSGSFVWKDSYSTDGYQISTFNPKYFALTGINKETDNRRIYYYNYYINSSDFYSIKLENNGTNKKAIEINPLGTNFIIENGFTIKFTAASWTGQTIYYMVCK